MGFLGLIFYLWGIPLLVVVVLIYIVYRLVRRS